MLFRSRTSGSLRETECVHTSSGNVNGIFASATRFYLARLSGYRSRGKMKDRQPLIIWINVVLMALTFAALCSRLWRRVFVMRRFNGQDGKTPLTKSQADTDSEHTALILIAAVR